MRTKRKLDEMIEEKSKNSILELTTCEMGKLLGLKSSTVIVWIKAGKIKCNRTLGGHRRIPITEYDKIEAIMKNSNNIQPENDKFNKFEDKTESKYPINKYKSKQSNKKN